MRFLIVNLMCFGVLVASSAADAQQARAYRVGVVFLGGPYIGALDGLREGLKELGMEEGKQIIFHLRDVKGDLKAAAAAAKSLEGEKVDLIYSVTTSVSVVVKEATRAVPIVFYAGNDPVSTGLVKSFAKPGGRVTGIYSRNTSLIAKRLELHWRR